MADNRLAAANSGKISRAPELRIRIYAIVKLGPQHFRMALAQVELLGAAPHSGVRQLAQPGRPMPAVVDVPAGTGNRPAQTMYSE